MTTRSPKAIVSPRTEIRAPSTVHHPKRKKTYWKAPQAAMMATTPVTLQGPSLQARAMSQSSVRGADMRAGTIAATGNAQTQGSYSSDAARNPPRALQVRITLD